MQVIKMLDVYLWDGGDRHNYAHSFNAESISEKDLQNKFKHCNVQKRIVVLFDNLTDFEANKIEQDRQRILEKLTPQERKILGFE